MPEAERHTIGVGGDGSWWLWVHLKGSHVVGGHESGAVPDPSREGPAHKEPGPAQLERREASRGSAVGRAKALAHLQWRRTGSEPLAGDYLLHSRVTARTFLRS